MLVLLLALFFFFFASAATRRRWGSDLCGSDPARFQSWVALEAALHAISEYVLPRQLH
jgi:hypothetical protein